MKYFTIVLFLFIGKLATGQGIPAQIKHAFNTADVKTQFYKDGWYVYDVWDSKQGAELWRAFLETCDTWHSSPPIWKDVITAREFAYDDWVIVLFQIKNENNDIGIAGSVMRKGVSYNKIAI